MPRIRAESIEAHKAASRQAILAAATKVFLSTSFAAASVSSIADVAGLPRTTLYEYFPSKGHILIAALEQGISPLVSDLLTRTPQSDPLEAIDFLFAESVAIAKREPDLAVLMFRVGRELPKPLRDLMWRILDPIGDELTRHCDAGYAQGQFGGVSPARSGKVLADLLISAMDEITLAKHPAAEAGEILESRRRFVRRGLVADGS